MNFANIFDNEVVLPLHLEAPEKSHDSSTTASQHLQSALQTPATTSPSSSSSATDLTLTSQKRKHPSVSKDDDTIANKRRRNNAAAAKYRQKKLDRIAELEVALGEVADERDALKLQLAKRDAEVEILRRLLDERGKL